MFVLVLPFAATQTSAPCPVLVGSGPGPLVFFPVTSSSAASVIVLLVLVVGVTPPVVVVSTVLALAILVLK